MPFSNNFQIPGLTDSRLDTKSAFGDQQTLPKNLQLIREAVQQFHRAIRRVADEDRLIRPVGRFALKQIANVGQTPLPFSFTSGGTYADAGDKTVWVRGGA